LEFLPLADAGSRTVKNVANISNVATIEYPDANTIIKTSRSLKKTFSSDDRGNLVSINNYQLSIVNLIMTTTWSELRQAELIGLSGITPTIF